MFGQRMTDLAGQELKDTEDEPVRELTVEEVFTIAIELHQVDRLVEAQAVYRQILAVEPEHARAKHFLGVVEHQLGHREEAVTLIQSSLALQPDNADWYSNLGIVLQEQERFEEAIDAYHRAIALDPQHANAHSNLGVLLRATGKPVDAEAAYRTAIRLNPEHIDAYNNLGVLLNAQQRSDEAVACFCKAITLRPQDKQTRRLLALAYCKLGEIDKAVTIFKEWLVEEPDDPIARHMLAACSGEETPARASDAFVSRTFDTFAASFESKLAKLSYRAPALVSAMLEDSGVAPAKQFDVLDMGCGTGLCGPLVAPYARRLTGVDLSEGMLRQAHEKHVYDQLFQVELTGYLGEHAAAFDVILSADTLVYFGPLDEVVAAAAAALRDGGLLIFTLERAVNDAGPDYHLELHGRYTHAQPYVERLLTGAGLVAEIAHAHLRMESGLPVEGLVVRARKSAARQ